MRAPRPAPVDGPTSLRFATRNAITDARGLLDSVDTRPRFEDLEPLPPLVMPSSDEEEDDIAPPPVRERASSATPAATFYGTPTNAGPGVQFGTPAPPGTASITRPDLSALAGIPQEAATTRARRSYVPPEDLAARQERLRRVRQRIIEARQRSGLPIPASLYGAAGGEAGAPVGTHHFTDEQIQARITAARARIAAARESIANAQAQSQAAVDAATARSQASSTITLRAPAAAPPAPTMVTTSSGTVTPVLTSATSPYRQSGTPAGDAHVIVDNAQRVAAECAASCLVCAS
jgi:hypothetical protein